MFDCMNIFDVFLPQLLRYPNPTDPLNSDAASLLLQDPSGYEKRIREFVAANSEHGEQKSEPEVGESDDMSDIGSISD